MRLAIVTHVIRENDGQGRVNLEVVRAALERGWTVVLFAAEISSDLKNHPSVTWIPIRYGRVPSNLLKYQIFALRSWFAIAKRRKDFDVLQTNGFISWASSDVNAVHFFHAGWYKSGFYPYKMSNGFREIYQVAYTKLNAVLEKLTLKRTRAIIAVSGRVASELSFRGIGGSIDVIHNGVDISTFQNVQKNREKFKLPNDKFLLLFAGDIRTHRKNLGTVLTTLQRLPAQIGLAVAGNIKGSPFPGMAKDLGVADRVYFLDNVKEMPLLMASVDVFVFPSRYDPFGLVIPEAMASGLPVVTSAKVGASEMLGGGGVVLSEPDDIDALVAAVTSIYEDPVLLERMKKGGRESADGHSWEAMAKQYLQVFERVFEEKHNYVPLPKR